MKKFVLAFIFLLILPEVTRAFSQYCYLDIWVKDDKGNELPSHIYIDENYVTYDFHTMEKVEIGTHKISASKIGYNSDSKTLTCSCGETKKVVLVLTSIQICTPGEIRNRYCACSTQVGYEKCKDDGSGWESVIENCPPGYVCSNGYCTLEKDGWYDTGKERCNLYGLECGSGTKEKEQEYRDYTCFGVTCTYNVIGKRWVSIGSCYQDCPSSYTCEAGYCVKTTTTLPCPQTYLDEFRCYGNWVQRKYLYSDCSTTWVNWEYCSYGCSNAACIEAFCKEGYLDNFRCKGNWIQREYRYSDCSTAWLNWKYCEFGCSDGMCLTEPKEIRKINVDVVLPTTFFKGNYVSANIKITNLASEGAYVDFGAYVCKTDPYCIPMSCDGYDPRIYVPPYTTRTLSCNARVEEKGSYNIKISYHVFGKTGIVYSKAFWVEGGKEKICGAKFLDEFKCSGNWKLQLYRYSDCSTAWVYVEYCGAGCSEGACLPSISTTTTTTLPVKEANEKETFTGFTPLVKPLNLVLLMLILAVVIILIIIWLWGNGLLKIKKKPECFGEDC
ncbi:MAG: hypothetical protein QW058_02910 [Candidatus Aenigmatarchaeota archaeon]